jgi:hypothetical protein
MLSPRYCPCKKKKVYLTGMPSSPGVFQDLNVIDAINAVN